MKLTPVQQFVLKSLAEKDTKVFIPDTSEGIAIARGLLGGNFLKIVGLKNGRMAYALTRKGRQIGQNLIARKKVSQ